MRIKQRILVIRASHFDDKEIDIEENWKVVSVTASQEQKHSVFLVVLERQS